MQIVYGMIFILVLGSIYVIGYYLNHKTPKPEGCEDMTENCGACGITSCGHHPNNQIKENSNA